MANRTSATGVLGDGWEEIVDCPVCFNILAHPPKVMNCGHSICSDCEKLVLQNGRICCPKCRKSSEITGIGLATNYVLQDIVEFCQNVELARVVESKFEYICVPCQQKLVLDQTLMCICCEHMSICGLCAFTGHKNHNVIFIKDQQEQDRRTASPDPPQSSPPRKRKCTEEKRERKKPKKEKQSDQSASDSERERKDKKKNKHKNTKNIRNSKNRNKRKAVQIRKKPMERKM